jgi:hypothetical protein
MAAIGDFSFWSPFQNQQVWMYISKNLVYLQMQKTGSSHVTAVLRKYTKGRMNEKHEQMTDYDKFKDRLIVSSIRNPWDWYVSLWAYGCREGGGLRKYLSHLPLSEIRHAATHRHLQTTVQSFVRLVSHAGRRPDWDALYSDSSNETNFRAWIRLLLGAEGRFIAKEDYSASAVKSVAGFMTYRFLSLTTEYNQWNSEGRAARSYGDMAAFADRHSIATRILRMESLDQDLADLLQFIGAKVSLADLSEMRKTNTSTHRKYVDYYDDETRQLVSERDRLVVDRFGYVF